jgi:hypothetical protein
MTGIELYKFVYREFIFGVSSRCLYVKHAGNAGSECGRSRRYCPGLDVLKRTIEAQVSTTNSPITDGHAISVIQGVKDKLLTVHR